MSLEKVNNKAYYLAYPMITPLITSKVGEEDNIMTATWTTPVSINPPLYGVSIAPGRYSHEIIEKSGEFGVCFMDFDDVEKVLTAGRVSGRKIDKFEKLDLQRHESSEISAPLLTNSISALECEITDSPKLGDHTFFVGKIVAAWVKENIQKEKVLDLEKVKPVFYLGSNRFCTTQAQDKLIKQ